MSSDYFVTDVLDRSGKASGVVCHCKPESETHRRLKMDILAACRAAGWEAQPEARAEDGAWRADVLAWRQTSRGRKQAVAFEVQLSTQAFAEIEARQSRYAASDVRGCWFIRPTHSKATHPERHQYFRKPTVQLPAFRIDLSDDGGPRVALPTGYAEQGDRLESLDAFVMALLSRRVRFATHTIDNRLQRARLIFVPIDCWKCGAKSHFYELDRERLGDDFFRDEPDCRTSCGRSLRSEWALYALRPDIVDAVTARLRAHPNDQIRLGAIKLRCKKAAEGAEMSFGCPECDALYGPSYLAKKVDEYTRTGAIRSLPFVDLEFPPSGRRSPDPHWCYPIDGPFCYGEDRQPLEQ